MDRYPCLTIDTVKLAHNTKEVIKLCERKNITAMAVTKLFQGNPKITQLMVDAGIKCIGDARIQNLIRLKDIKAEKVLIRLPMLNEIDLLVEYADISLNSEIETVRAISEYCTEHNKTHKVVLMVDMGDRREGVNEEDLLETAKVMAEFEGVELVGIGVNYGCFGGVIPSKESMTDFMNYAKEIQESLNLKFTHITGGSSLHLHMIWEDILPEGVTHLRIGQSINLGVEDKYGKVIDGLYGDVYRLHAQVIEKKTKPSVPKGQIGIDAFGKVPVFEDKGNIDRLILGIGRQDVILDGLIPENDNIKIIGASSDHMILDITDCKKEYHIGDIISFDMNYSSLLSVFNSEYVYKKYI